MGKRNSQLQELTVVAQNDYLTIVDTSAGQSKRVSVKTLVGNVDLGWVATGESWTYSSWTSGTRVGVITVPSDATTKYSPGMRTRFSQTTGGTKYGIILAVTSTTLTVFFPSGTTFTNETITSPVYSSIKVPYGFPLNPVSWSLIATDTNQALKLSPSVSTWYGGGALSTAGLSLTVPVGGWILDYRTITEVLKNTATSTNVFVTLSTSSSAETNQELTSRQYLSGASGNRNPAMTATGTAPINQTSQQTWYLNISTQTTSATQIAMDGNLSPTVITARCAYL